MAGSQRDLILPKDKNMSEWFTNAITARGSVADVEDFLFRIRGNFTTRQTGTIHPGRRWLPPSALAAPLGTDFDLHVAFPELSSVLPQGLDVVNSWCERNWGIAYSPRCDISSMSFTRNQRTASIDIRLETICGRPVGLVAGLAKLAPALSFRLRIRGRTSGQRWQELFGGDQTNNHACNPSEITDAWQNRDIQGLVSRTRLLRVQDGPMALVVQHADPTVILHEGPIGPAKERFGWRVALVDLWPHQRQNGLVFNKGPYANEHRAFAVADGVAAISLSGRFPCEHDLPDPAPADLRAAAVDHFLFWDENPPDTTAHERMQLRKLASAHIAAGRLCAA